MNSKILEYYQNVIKRNIEYLNNTSIRSSLEDYKAMVLADTSGLKSEWDINNNLSFINSFYSQSITILEEHEKEMNICINKIIKNLMSIDSDILTQSIHKQIISSLKNFKLKTEFEIFEGLLFEYDSSPSFSGTPIKEQNLEVILENSKYLELDDGSHASDHAIEFELEELLKPILNEEFEETAWVFEFELDIFLKIKETTYSQVAISLNKSLNSTDIKNTLNEKGFSNNGIAYLNEHDLEEKTVFINK